MSGARELLLALLLARVVGGGPGTALGATAELTAGGPHKAVRRNEAAAPYRASAVRVVRAGAQISAGDPLPFLHRRAPRAAPSPLPAARGLPARGRPPGVCSLCRPGAGSSSRLASSRWAGAASQRRGCPAGRRRPFRSGWARAEAVWRSRGSSREPQRSDVNAIAVLVAHLPREAARFRGGSRTSFCRPVSNGLRKTGLGCLVVWLLVETGRSYLRKKGFVYNWSWESNYGTKDAVRGRKFQLFGCREL